jgi:hypothetical protein
VLQLVAHVSANKVILRRWEEGSVREWSAISYPNQVRLLLLLLLLLANVLETAQKNSLDILA